MKSLAFLQMQDIAACKCTATPGVASGPLFGALRPRVGDPSPYKGIFRLPTVSHVLLSVLDGCRVNNLGTMLLKDWKCLMEERVLPLWGWFERCFAVTSAVYIHLDPVSPLCVTPSGPPVPLPLFHWSESDTEDDTATDEPTSLYRSCH